MNKFGLTLSAIGIVWASVPARASEPALAPATAAHQATTDPIHREALVQPAEAAQSKSGQMVLPKDTPIHLMVLNEVTTKTHGAGFRFPLRVNEPVLVDGHVAIPIGATAWGEVLDAERSGNVGKSGRLAARLLYLDLSGKHIAISGDATARGNSGTAETVVGVIGLGVLGLFAKGNNAKLKAGEMMTAFTSADETITVPTEGSAAKSGTN